MGSPWPAYDPAFLARVASIEGEPPPDLEGAMRAAANHLITIGGEPHDRFEAQLTALQPIEGGETSWRLTARGDDVDAYSVVVARRDGGFVADEEAGALFPLPEPVRSPASVRAPAEAAVNRSAELAPLVAGFVVLDAGWDAALPSCVHLHYVGDEKQAGDAREAKTLVVNVARGQVVHVR